MSKKDLQINSVAGEAKSSSGGPCDEQSRMGRFGWAKVGKVYLPYIYRQTSTGSEKYFSARMFELKLGTYLNYFQPEIYASCVYMPSYYITDAEARLFNEVNAKHCDGQFGCDKFKKKDLVVRLGDAFSLQQFLNACYRKLKTGSSKSSDKFGFIRINKESVIPYTVHNKERVLPLFYFRIETENLETKTVLLNGWDLAYLKFCCKVQGVANEYYSGQNVAVMSLTDIKSGFPNGTEFEDYWPSEYVDNSLLIGNRANVKVNFVKWNTPTPLVRSAADQNANLMSLADYQKQQRVAAVAALHTQPAKRTRWD
ncbi:uncharacterized protein LOC117582231 [Drosophila guanche]|uniref:Uncharacterized protein n=1 Tax=Drosophila guanche TaxID=7266 RepID=A0A3B0JBZ7_DROGU|nr:uncharacterized protein LOC117582231 [Drosophila guanche]SPP79575.1 Hypothetical predicted protein [Drosophila guanche]